jgi:hypothetical protein
MSIEPQADASPKKDPGFRVYWIVSGVSWLAVMAFLWLWLARSATAEADGDNVFYVLAAIFTFFSFICFAASWIVGRRMGPKGGLVVAILLGVAVLFLPLVVMEGPSVDSILFSLPIFLPPIVFGFLTGGRSWIRRQWET